MPYYTIHVMVNQERWKIVSHAYVALVVLVCVCDVHLSFMEYNPLGNMRDQIPYRWTDGLWDATRYTFVCILGCGVWDC